MIVWVFVCVRVCVCVCVCECECIYVWMLLVPASFLFPSASKRISKSAKLWFGGHLKRLAHFTCDDLCKELGCDCASTKAK